MKSVWTRDKKKGAALFGEKKGEGKGRGRENVSKKKRI